MENIKELLSVYPGYGYGYGDGSGYGYSDGYGYGDGFGSGFGDGSGSGSVSVSGYGSGYGDGYGSNSSLSSGSDSGYGDDDIAQINGEKIYLVDGISTIIKNARNNIAKCLILNSDLTFTPCYVVKIDNCFAHAATIKEAVKQAKEKALKLLSEDERIEKFWVCHNIKDKYPAKDLYEWHHILTGSCEMGRNQFVREKGVDLERDTFTVNEFVKMCKNDYGGDIINKLIKRSVQNERKKSSMA